MCCTTPCFGPSLLDASKHLKAGTPLLDVTHQAMTAAEVSGCGSPSTLSIAKLPDLPEDLHSSLAASCTFEPDTARCSIPGSTSASQTRRYKQLSMQRAHTVFWSHLTVTCAGLLPELLHSLLHAVDHKRAQGVAVEQRYVSRQVVCCLQAPPGDMAQQSMAVITRLLGQK